MPLVITWWAEGVAPTADLLQGHKACHATPSVCASLSGNGGRSQENSTLVLTELRIQQESGTAMKHKPPRCWAGGSRRRWPSLTARARRVKVQAEKQG